MPTTFHRLAWLLTGIISSVLVGLGSCSDVTSPQSMDPIPTPQVYLPCSSEKFALPESIVRNGEELDSEAYAERLFTRRIEQQGWLSVHLDLTQEQVEYGAAVPFRLTITNETDHPVIFVRPLHVSFIEKLHLSPYPLHLFFDIVTSSGERIRPYPLWVHAFFPLPTAEMFSMLSPGESCVAEIQFNWDQTFTPLDEPIAPGEYQVRVALRGSDLGPGTESYERLDIGAWVGASSLSNAITMTILPVEE